MGTDGRPRVVWIDRGVTTHADDTFSIASRTNLLTCEAPGCHPDS